MTKYVTTDGNGRSATHADPDCYTLHKGTREATAREIERLTACPHCTGDLDPAAQDWSYQHALRNAGGDD